MADEWTSTEAVNKNAAKVFAMIIPRCLLPTELNVALHLWSLCFQYFCRYASSQDRSNRPFCPQAHGTRRLPKTRPVSDHGVETHAKTSGCVWLRVIASLFSSSQNRADYRREC